MNEFGYIAATRANAAEQQARLEHERLVRTAQRAAKQRRIAERRRQGIGSAPRIGLLLRTLARRPGRTARLRHTASSTTCTTGG